MSGLKCRKASNKESESDGDEHELEGSDSEVSTAKNKLKAECCQG